MNKSEIMELVRNLEDKAHRKGELWERCQGKGWPQAESEEFTKLRDERIPEIRAAIEAALHDVPADPMDWPLPCDVKVGHGTVGKGCKLSTLVARMKVLYEIATGNDADVIAQRTDEERKELADRFRSLFSSAAALPDVPTVPERTLALNAALAYVERHTPRLVYSEIASALSAAPEPAQPTATKFPVPSNPETQLQLAAIIAARDEEPAQAEQPKKSNCMDCANADSWGLPDKAICDGCVSGCNWSPLNTSSVNPNVQAEQPRNEPVQQEPVMIYHGRCVVDCGDNGHHDVELLRMIPKGTKLFTAPQAQPMSDEQAAEIIENLSKQQCIGTRCWGWKDVIRAVERFHKIGG
jgi:hypothetical protein